LVAGEMNSANVVDLEQFEEILIVNILADLGPHPVRATVTGP
jgi:hypothetical protein